MSKTCTVPLSAETTARDGTTLVQPLLTNRTDHRIGRRQPTALRPAGQAHTTVDSLVNDEDDIQADPHASFLAAIEAQEAAESDDDSQTDLVEEDSDEETDETDDSTSEEDEDEAGDSDEEDEAEGSDDEEQDDDPVEDDSDDADEGDDETDSEETDSYLIFDEAEGREVFLRAEDPETGETSVYDTREAAAEGFGRILSHVGELTQQIETQNAASTARIAELETQLDRYQRGTGMTPEQQLNTEIHSRLGDDVKALLIDADGNAVDPKTLSEEAYGTYRRAVIDAREELKSEIERARTERVRAKTQKAEAAKAAETHVNSRRRDYQFFGVRNADARIALDKTLTTKTALPSAVDAEGNPVEMAPLDVAALLAEEIGTDAADAYLRGMAAEVSKSTPAAKKKAGQTTKAKVKKVRKAAKTSMPKKPSGSSRKKTSGGVNDNPMKTFESAWDIES